MGCNYYVESYPPCKECGHIKENIHLGKSSHGWRFLFQAHYDPPIYTWRHWEMLIMGGSYIIKDEYDKTVLLNDFTKIVNIKQCDEDHISLRDLKVFIDPQGYEFTYENFS